LEKKEYVRPRNVNLAFRVSEDERKMIEDRMKQAGMNNMRAFIVKQALEGRIIHIELDSVREMVRLLSNATNNINQIARRVNERGNFYATDLENIKERIESLWTQTKEILRRLSAIK
jgi:alpha/beta superfamily hydrolase